MKWLCLVALAFLLTTHAVAQVVVQNRFLGVEVDDDSGDFFVFTTQGDPADPLDDGRVIVAQSGSFVTLRIYNVPTGDVPPFQTVDLQLSGDGSVDETEFQLLNVLTPQSNVVTATWAVFIPRPDPTDPTAVITPTTPSLLVDRLLTLVGDAVEVRVSVTNMEAIPRLIGVRLALNPSVNPLAAAGNPSPGPFLLPGQPPVINEQLFTGIQQVPEQWVYVPALDQTALSVRGIVMGSEATPPDRAVFAQVANLTANLFDYLPASFLRLDTADSGVALVWDNRPIVLGQSIQFVSYVGLNLTVPDYRRPYSIMVLPLPLFSLQMGDNPFTPETELAFITPDPFPVTAIVHNYSVNPLTGVSLTIALPDGMVLVPGESATKAIGTLSALGEQTVSWQVQFDLIDRQTGEPRLGVSGNRPIIVSAVAIPGGGRQATVTAVVPFLPLRSFPAGFHMVGFPFDFENPEPSVALGIPASDLRLARYDPFLNRYLIFGQGVELTRLEAGQGYWLRFLTPQTVVLNGVKLRSLTTPVVVPVRKGWNQLANPFPYPILLSGIQFAPGTALSPLSFDEAVTQQLVRRAIFLWQPDPLNPNNPPFGAYQLLLGTTIHLQPWEGFWVFCEADGIFLFSSPQFVGPLQTRSRSVSLAELFPSDGWSVQLVAESSVGSDNLLWLGVSAQATNGLDAWDIPKPPPIPGGLQVSSVLEQGRNRLPLSVDIRPPQGRSVWTLEIVNPPGGEVQLKVQDLSRVPRFVVLTLHDPETGKNWSLRAVNTVRFKTQPSQPKRLQLIALNVGQLPLRVQGLQATPVRGRGVQIRFAVTMPAQVRVQVRSLTGRVLWETGVLTESVGVRSVFWNGRSRTDQPLPLGVYAIVVQAFSDDGRQSQAQTIVRVTK